MFKVKLSFDTDRLEQDILEQLYDKVDEIFESEDLSFTKTLLFLILLYSLRLFLYFMIPGTH